MIILTYNHLLKKKYFSLVNMLANSKPKIKKLINPNSINSKLLKKLKNLRTWYNPEIINNIKNIILLYLLIKN